MTGLIDLLEALTIFCFGLSWPISIRKSLISRTAKGKSLLFLLFIFTGYMAGIAWKMILLAETGEIKWPTYFYFLNLIMVGTDIVMYFRNKRLDNKKS